MFAKIFSIVFGFALLGSAIVVAAWPDQPVAGSVKPKKTRVRVECVDRADQKRVVRFSGIARASDRARLTFSLPGRLAVRRVDLGDRVDQGDLLAKLDDQAFQHAREAAESTLAELEARLAQAQRDQARVTQLANAKAATTEEVEKTATAARVLRASVASARVGLKEARRVERESKLLAPFPGTITAVHLEPGEWASPGVPIVEIAGESNLEVEVHVPETIVTHLSHDQEIQVDLPFSDTSTTGRLMQNALAARGPGSLFPVVIHLAGHPNLVPGSTVEVLIPVAFQDTLSLPVQAVLNPGSATPSVFRVRHGRAEKVEVQLGHLTGGHISVLANLAIGDEVVVAGHTLLSDGAAVEVHR